MPVSDRIGHCSLVSIQFCKAAAAVTHSISKDLQADADKNDSLMAWLQQHSTALSSLHLSNPNKALTALPCQNLLQLDLSKCRVLLNASRILDRSTGLTRLTLKSCRVVDAGPESLAQLTDMQSLQRLDLQLARPAGDASDLNNQPEAALTSSLLQQLPMLTTLAASGHVDLLFTQDGSTSGMSALTGLQQLKLAPDPQHEQHVPITGLACVQQLLSLKTLVLEKKFFKVADVRPTLATAPYFTQLTALECLQLWGLSVETAALPACPGLLDFSTGDVHVLGVGSSFLSYLGSLTNLTRLGVMRASLDEWPAPAAAYTALAASSRLVHVRLAQPPQPFDPKWSRAQCAQILDQLSAAWQLQTLELWDIHFDDVSSSRCCHNPTSLCSLELNSCNINPGPISTLTQLTCLVLQSVTVMLPAVAARVGAADPPIPSQAADGMLHMLAQLQQLQHLRLGRICSPDSQPSPWPAAGPAYSATFRALFASTQLGHLELSNARLPEGALQHALSVPQQLPHLTHLTATEYDHRGGGDWSYAKMALDSASIAALACQMPNLCSCNVAVQAGADLSPLAQLSGLTHLSVCVRDSSSMCGFAAVTQLPQLTLHCAGPVAAADVVALTTLKQFTSSFACQICSQFTLWAPLWRDHHSSTFKDL